MVGIPNYKFVDGLVPVDYQRSSYFDNNGNWDGVLKSFYRFKFISVELFF